MEKKSSGLMNNPFNDDLPNLYDISWQVSEKEYRKGEGLSYSTLSRYEREGFEKLDELFNPISGPHLTFGSLVDTLLTGTPEELEEQYMVAEFPSVKPQHLVLVEYLFDNYSDKYATLDDIPDKDIISSTEIVKFNTHWLPATRVKSIKEEATEYYNLNHLAQGKEIVATKMYNDAVEVANVLRNHRVTKWYFEENRIGGVERFYQLKFKGEYDDIPIRCMADEIIVDHKTKTIYPIDLKTSGKPEHAFIGSFIHWRYHIQARMYWYIIKQNLDKHPVFKNYKLENYTFIIISNETRIPLIWNYEDTTLEGDLVYGKNKDVILKDWRTSLKELNYYLTYKPSLPIGIKDVNSITEILNKNY